MATNKKTKKQVIFKASDKVKSKKIDRLKTPNPQLFINSLSDEEANMFMAEIHVRGGLSHLVNHRHIYPFIELTELATMRSIRPQDGA
jgi:hypothetical protein